MKKLTKWKLIKSKPIFETKWMSVYSNTYKLPNGKVGKDYYHLSRPNYILILALDDQNNLILERNYRRGVDDFVFELPAGWINPGETPDKAAIRELREETGYLGTVEFVMEIYPEPGYTSMRAIVVVMDIDQNRRETQVQEEDEDISYELVNLDKINSMIASGQIRDMGMLAAISILKGRQF